MDKFSVVVNGLGNVAVGCVQHQGAREQQEDSVGSVSYTHLTLPTT